MLVRSHPVKGRIRETYRCPPDSSVKLCFHTLPKQTFTSNPSLISLPSGGSNFAVFPGSRSLKINPKSSLTLLQVLNKASFLYSSKLAIVSSILRLSLITVRIICFKLASFFSTLSIMFMTAGLIFFFMPWKRSVTFLRLAFDSAMFWPWKS